MSSKDSLHHVHFGKEVDNFGKDNEIGYEFTSIDKSLKLTIHLGFLQIHHVYRVELKFPRSLCKFEPETKLIFMSGDIPNLYIKIMSVHSYPEYFVIILELLAHKEKLLKERVQGLQTEKEKIPLQMYLIARVLGKGKGTPLLRNGITSIRVEPDDESDASDWQGFTKNE